MATSKKNDQDAMHEAAERAYGCECLCAPVLPPGPGNTCKLKPTQWSKAAPRDGKLGVGSECTTD